jgi:hypothetical protein
VSQTSYSNDTSQCVTIVFAVNSIPLNITGNETRAQAIQRVLTEYNYIFLTTITPPVPANVTAYPPAPPMPPAIPPQITSTNCVPVLT